MIETSSTTIWQAIGDLKGRTMETTSTFGDFASGNQGSSHELSDELDKIHSKIKESQIELENNKISMRDNGNHMALY